jgi:thiol-disulfide isomerase/thioredoxin
MDNNSLKKIEKLLIKIFIALGILVIIGIILLIKFKEESPKTPFEEEQEETKEQEYDWEAGLSDNTLWLPEYCQIYSKVPEFTFSDEQGKMHSISDFEGKPVIVVFWASWCSDCQEQMPMMNRYIELAKKYEDIQFLFVNKTDGSKETKEAAVSYFKKQEINGMLCFDEELTAYDTLGIHNIPTTLFLDKEGIITAWSPKQITEITKFDALLIKAIYGGSHATSAFISSKLMDEQGAIHSSYGKSKDITYGTDILSESEGAMLEYAVLSKNQELFDQILNYIQNNLWGDGLTAWKVSSGKASSVNALIDDLRIYEAIYEANNVWSGYDEILKNYEGKLLTYGIQDGKYSDIYDTESKEYVKRITLCFGDLKTMKLLAEDNPEFEAPYNECKDILVNGQISEEFPLYYSWYDYKSKEYKKDDLNMAEAMVTFLHLAEDDLLPENSLGWLKTQMEHEGVKARYSVSGEIVDGCDYDSTAVYALIAMIGVEEKDKILVSQAVKKMEKMRIDDTSFAYNGAFGMEDGSGITSFDQVMPVLAYMRIYEK